MRVLRREAIILSALLAFGVLVMPFAIYLVGSRVIGEYRPDANAASLAVDLWGALAGGSWAAWLLVASPYLVVQALRAARALWRGRKPVTHVTNPRRETRNWRV